MEWDWYYVIDALSSTIVYDDDDLDMVRETLQELAQLHIQYDVDRNNQDSYKRRNEFVFTLQSAAAAIAKLLIDGNLLNLALGNVRP